jgi:hypothetical protein
VRRDFFFRSPLSLRLDCRRLSRVRLRLRLRLRLDEGGAGDRDLSEPFSRLRLRLRLTDRGRRGFGDRDRDLERERDLEVDETDAFLLPLPLIRMFRSFDGFPMGSLSRDRTDSLSLERLRVESLSPRIEPALPLLRSEGVLSLGGGLGLLRRLDERLLSLRKRGARESESRRLFELGGGGLLEDVDGDLRRRGGGEGRVGVGERRLLGGGDALVTGEGER